MRRVWGCTEAQGFHVPADGFVFPVWFWVNRKALDGSHLTFGHGWLFTRLHQLV